MKLKYIEVNGHGILVDEKANIKYGDFFYNSFNDNQPKIQRRKGDWLKCYNHKKIIFAEAGLNIDVPVVPDWREWELKQKALKLYPIKSKPIVYTYDDGVTQDLGIDEDVLEDERKAFVAGYNYNKAKYTAEDISTAIFKAIDIWMNNMMNDSSEINEEDIQSILRSLEKVPQYIVMIGNEILEVIY